MRPLYLKRVLPLCPLVAEKQSKEEADEGIVERFERSDQAGAEREADGKSKKEDPKEVGDVGCSGHTRDRISERGSCGAVIDERRSEVIWQPPEAMFSHALGQSTRRRRVLSLG